MPRARPPSFKPPIPRPDREVLRELKRGRGRLTDYSKVTKLKLPADVPAKGRGR